MPKLSIIQTLDGLVELTNKLKIYDYISYDTETTGIVSGSKIIGFSICGSLDESFYVIIYSWDVSTNSLIELETLAGVVEFLDVLKTKKLLMHNAIFDCMMTKQNYNIDLMPALHTDTLILGHLLNENRRNGLKELGASLFGENVKDEQTAMKASVTKNGGVLKKNQFELYKGDAELIGRYGAQDAALTYKLFYTFIPELYEQNLQDFFYKDESMPLLKGPTYDLNRIGLRIDPEKLSKLKSQLEVECMESKAIIFNEIMPLVKTKYPGDKKTNGFNINSSMQLSWLLFVGLGEVFDVLTDGGKKFCKDNSLKIPYTHKAKREFISYCTNNKGATYSTGKFNRKSKKMDRPLKVKDFWCYLSSDKYVLNKFAEKYKWVAELLKYSKNMTILNTYVIALQEKMTYNIIHPSFLQHGTTSGRYSSKNPNFQNLPRDDKRVKACIVARPGKVFIGADYSQLEPRVFASVSKDETLMKCFENKQDFYSVVGAPIFNKSNISLIKDDSNSFAKLFPRLRDQAKVIALATPYGRTASFTASQMNVTREDAQNIMNKYFEAYPKVELMMLESHEQAKANGIVYSLFGRPRRIPQALEINNIAPDKEHGELPYELRNILNLAMNHRVQSTAASIVNRASIAFCNKIKELGIKDCNLVLQVHDQLVAECLEKDATEVSHIMQYCMEYTVELPGVKLEAIPFISKTLAEQK